MCFGKNLSPSIAEGTCFLGFVCYQGDGLESSVRGGDGRIVLNSLLPWKENIALIFEDTFLCRHTEILRVSELCIHSRATSRFWAVPLVCITDFSQQAGHGFPNMQ